MHGLEATLAGREKRTLEFWKDKWADNASANKSRIAGYVQDLWKDVNYKTGVLIAAGPSLSDSIEELRSLDRTKHDVVAVDMSLGFLLASGIVPDYVICSDASPVIARTLEVPGIPDSLPLLLNVTVNPGTAKRWRGPIHWYAAASNVFDKDNGKWMEKDHQSRSGVPCTLVPGGNVSSLGLSFLLGVRAVPKLLLYGADFCWSVDSSFYCGGVNGDLAEKRIRSEAEAGTIYAMKDSRGRDVMTNGSLLSFAQWFFDRTHDYPGVIENRTPITILQDGGK